VGAAALGCTVVPPAWARLEMQVAAIRRLGIDGFSARHRFSSDRRESRRDEADLSCLKKAQVGAEYRPPALRSAMKERGSASRRCMPAPISPDRLRVADVDGAVNEGMILEEARILEMCGWYRRSCAGGEVAKCDHDLQRDYPLIRFATCDLSPCCPARAPAAGPNVRIKGWMAAPTRAPRCARCSVTPRSVAT